MFKKHEHIASSCAVSGLIGAYLLGGYKNHGLKRAGAKISCFIDSKDTTSELLKINTLFLKSTYSVVIIQKKRQHTVP